MKTRSLCVLMLLWAVPAGAQTNHLATVQRIRATYPGLMSEAQKAELLNRVAWEHRSEGWGLLKKTGGSRCPAPQGVDVACDILVYAPTAWHFDVLVDGQIPAWQDDGPCDPAVSGCDMSRFVAPVRPAQVPVLVRGDADGDGKAEISVFRPTTGTWFVRASSTEYASSASAQWGLPGDIPVIGDFDGDGKTDLTVFRPRSGEWYIRYSSLDYSASSWSLFQWGLPGDIPLAADFDGDGKTELSVFRPSTGEWFIRYSSLAYSISSYVAYQWGLPGDVPLPGDFDGDGKSELAVFRPSGGYWFIRYSSSG